MTNIDEWLENVKSPRTAPSAPFLQPMDGILVEENPMDQVTPLNIDQNGDTYFDMRPAWEYPLYQSQADDEPFPIDPSLCIMADLPAPTTSGRTVVTVPEEFAETSSKILIYLTQVLDIPEGPKDVDKEFTEEMMFTAEELEALESITEGNSEPSIPNDIDGVHVNTNPKSKEIKEIIDLRHVGSHRRTFYLARTIGGVYYWFHSPRVDRDHQLRKLAGDYRRKSQLEVGRRKKHGIRKLRSGRKIRM
jgi:hypothetical protein